MGCYKGSNNTVNKREKKAFKRIFPKIRKNVVANHISHIDFYYGRLITEYKLKFKENKSEPMCVQGQILSYVTLSKLYIASMGHIS